MASPSTASKRLPMTDKLPDNDHGNRFQSKLLFLSFIRAINKEYKFHLGTELYNFAGKFDDLIFVKEGTSDDGHPIKDFLYLQAKHRMHEKPHSKGKSISTADLLNDNKGDFGLMKYFHSYRDNVAKAKGGPKPEDKVDCIICTNIGFDYKDLENNGVQLVKLDPSELNDLPRELFSFTPIPRQSQINKGKKKKSKETDHLGFVATYLRNCAQAPYDPPGEPNQSFKKYLNELLSNNPIISHFSAEATEQMKFHQDFIDGDEAQLTEDAKKLRKIIINLAKDGSWKNWEFSFCNNKIPTCYRLKPIRWLEMHYVANVLCDCAKSQTRKLDKQDNEFQSYQAALINGKVIDIQEKKFHDHFINNNEENLPPGVKELRNIIDRLDRDWANWTFAFNDVSTFHNPTDVPHKNLDDSETIEDFFNNKLVFAVNTPNEEELNQVVKDEVGEYFKLIDNDLQSPYILSEMTNWFKQDKNVWLSAEDGKKIILDKINEKMNLWRTTAVSINFQEKLNQMLNFEDSAVEEMANNLTWLIGSRRKMERIKTASPKLTAVKVIAALERLEDYKQHDSYLVLPFKYLQNEGEREQMKQLLHAAVNSHHLLVIVCEEINSVSNSQLFKSLETMIPDKEVIQNGKKKKGIIIGGNEGAISDECNFNDFNEEAIKKMLDKWVSFQDKKVQVRDLVPTDSKPEDIFESSAIVEMIEQENEVIIPSLHTDESRFNKSLYIERSLNFPLLSDEFPQKPFEIHSNGNIKWLVTDEKSQKEIWKEMKNEKSKSRKQIREDKLIVENGAEDEKVMVIIEGLAGMGKTTILSNYYEELKKKNQNLWVIRIDLVDISKNIFDFDFSHKTAIDFLVDLPAVVGKSSFSKSLLRHRLETGDRIVIMLDGFDEINVQCQEKVTELVKSLVKQPVKLYVTTRPHMIDKLQDQFFQFSYNLEPLSEENQLVYLTSFWMSKLEVPAEEDRKRMLMDSLREFAEIILKRVSEALNDKEKEFMGIPLQCKMLAENFEFDIHEHVKKSLQDNPEIKVKLDKLTNEKDQFDLASFYESFFRTKGRLYCEEKAQSSSHSNQYVAGSLEDSLEQIMHNLTKLAIDKIVVDEKKVKLLWPMSTRQSKTQKSKEGKKTIDDGIKFGLIYKHGDDAEVQFLHRTYAEYLVAKFLYEGFLLEEEAHNRLLDNDPAVQQFIATEILMKDEYNGVRIFFNSMLKEIVNSEEWSRINQQDSTLPERLKQLVEYAPKTEYIRSIKERNSNVFIFLFDCLQATSNQTKVKEIVVSAFYSGKNSSKRVEFERYYEQSFQVFERLMKYYDATSEDKVEFILNMMLRSGLPSNCIDWKYNRIERENILKHMFDFMTRAQENGRLNLFLDPNANEAISCDADLLRLLTCKEGYEILLKQYLAIYLSVYPNNDNVVMDLLTTLFKRYESHYDVNHQTETKRCTLNLLKGRTQNFLNILKSAKRNEVLQRISPVVLKRDPISFQQFYEPKEPTEYKAIMSEKKGLLLDRDSARMTGLHRAAYYNKTELVEQILIYVADNNKTDLRAMEVTNCLARDDEGFTPLYVAYARRHKEIGTQIMEFLGKVLNHSDLKTHMTDKNGFLHLALLETFIFEETEILEWILTDIKRIFGQDLLYCILTSDNCKHTYIGFDRPRKKFAEITTKLLLDDHDGERYNKLNNFIFINKNFVKEILLYATKDTLEKLILADGGIRNWMKRFFYIKEHYGLLRSVIESHIIDAVNNDVRDQLIEDGKSVVEKLGSHLDDRRAGYIPDMFRCILYYGEEALKDVLLHNDGASITRIILSSNGYIAIAKIISELIPSDNKKIIAQRIIYHALIMIPDKRKETGNGWFFGNCMSILPLVVDYASKEQLSQFVEIILLEPRNGNSFWKCYLVLSKGIRQKNEQEIYSDLEVKKFLECVSTILGAEALQRLREMVNLLISTDKPVRD